MKMIVATTILEQLGGNKFIAMTGAKDLVGQADSLMFKLPKKPGFVKQGINFVKIILMPDDTYKIEFSKISLKRYVKMHWEIKRIDDVYCDQLQELFTEVTGLDTHL